MTTLPLEPASDSGTPAPRRKRIWWKRWKLWLPLGFVAFVVNSCTPNYDYVWFEADVTVDGQDLTITQMIECAYRGSSIWPIEVYSPSKTNAAVGARLQGGTGLMIWLFDACQAADTETRRDPLKFIAGINWLDDIRKPVRMEFYPTHKSVTAEGSRVWLNYVRFTKGPNFILQALLYPAYWRDNIFGITWTIPYLDRTPAEIQARLFVGLIACFTPQRKLPRFDDVLKAPTTLTEPRKVVKEIAFLPGRFFNDCARGLPHVEGQGWVFDGDQASLPLFMPAHEVPKQERAPIAFGQPEVIETRGEGFVIKRYGSYSFHLPSKKLFVNVTPVGNLGSYRIQSRGP